MGLFRRFDAWVGLRLFHPPIIRFCQWTGYTQHRLHRDMWFAAILYVTWVAARDGDSGARVVFSLALCLIAGLYAALRPADEGDGSAPWLRAIIWFFTALGLPIILDGNALYLAHSIWILTAEYAATITNIPPRRPRERRPRAATQPT